MTRMAALRILLVVLWIACPASARADFELERTLALEPGGELVIDADSGRITVRGDGGSDARVRIHSPRSSDEDRFRFRLDGDGSRAVVEVDRRGLSWFNWRGDSLHIEVRVPTDTAVRLETAGGSITLEKTVGDAFLDTSGGRIEVSDVRGDVDAHTSGGAIVAERISGDLVADTSGGSITVEEVTGSVHAETSGGSISMEEIGGRVHARSSGGSVRVGFAAGNAAGGDLSTSGGSVSARVDPAVGLDIDASTSGGRVTADLPVEVRGRIGRGSLRGTLNGGGETLRLRSSGGGVRLAVR